MQKEFFSISFPKPQFLQNVDIEVFDIFHILNDEEVFFQAFLQIGINGRAEELEIYPWVKANMKELRPVLLGMNDQSEFIEVPVTTENPLPIIQASSAVDLLAEFDLDQKTQYPRLIINNINRDLEISQQEYWDWIALLTGDMLSHNNS